MIINYEFKYRARGKWFFRPNEKCIRRGDRMLEYFKRRVVFPDFMYHPSKGRPRRSPARTSEQQKLFFKIDIQNFYYSIARMRVTRALRGGAIPEPLHSRSGHAFSTHFRVRNTPCRSVRAVAAARSLVLMKSEVADAIERAHANGVCISVYLDDFIGSPQ